MVGGEDRGATPAMIMTKGINSTRLWGTGRCGGEIQAGFCLLQEGSKKRIGRRWAL